MQLRDDLITSHVISRHNYFLTVGGWLQALYMKTKDEITIHPICLQLGLGGWFFSILK